MGVLSVITFGMVTWGTGVMEAEVQPQVPLFVDIAPAAHVDVYVPRSHYLAVGCADYDGDGWLDLYMGIEGVDGRWSGFRVYPRALNQRWNRLYHNEGNGTFREVTAVTGVVNPGDVQDIAWADYDNDGALDLYVSNADTTGLLYHNNGDGTFTNVTVAAGVLDAARGGAGAAWADYNRDRWVDLYVAMIRGGSRLYQNRGDGTFAEVANVAGVAKEGFTVAWGDYDQDMWPDMVVTNKWLGNIDRPNADRRVWVYHNQKDGTFREAGETTGIGASLRRSGTGNNTWSRVTAYGVAWADYDNDGWLDLAIAGENGVVSELYRSRGDGTFQQMGRIARQQDYGNDLTWVDLDNDGWLDLFAGGTAVGGTVGDTYLNQPYLNQGDGTFVEIARMLGAATTTGNTGTESAAWGDYDHDGFPDGYIAVNGLPNQLHRNSGNGNHWFILEPVGVRSNRSAIGTKVWLVTGKQRQLREISGGSGYSSHSLSGAAFGVGTATRIDSVIVWWPSGEADRWTDLAVDQAIEVMEGQAPAFRVLYGTGAWQLDQPLASPNILPQGRLVPVRLTIRVISPTPGQRPAQVTADLRAIGGAKAVTLRDDGQMGDVRASDGIWSRLVRVSPTGHSGEYGLPVIVRDARGQPQGSAGRIHLTIWPLNRAIYSDSLAAGWQVATQGTATSDMAASDHVYQGRVAHRLRLGSSKATVSYRAKDPVGVPVWGTQVIEMWVWGATIGAMRGVTVNGLTLSGVEVPSVAQQWLRVQLPIKQMIERSQGLTDRLPEVVFGRVASGGPVEVWVDEVRIVAAPYPGARQKVVAEELPDDQRQVALLPNAPNPFNAETVLRYRVGGTGNQPVVLKIYNLVGQVVRTLVEEEQGPGGYTVSWDGRDRQEHVVASGVYLARLAAGGITQTQKLLLLR